MDAVHQALSRLASSLSWFVGASDVRALHVVTQDALRSAVLEQVIAAAHDPQSRAVWLLCEADAVDPDVAWQERCEEVRLGWAALGEALAEESTAPEAATEWEPLHAVPEAAEGVMAMGLLLQQAVERLAPLFDQIVVVLAPGVTPVDSDRWVRDCSALMNATSLDGVRWLVVDIDVPVSANCWTNDDAVERVDVCTSNEDRTAFLKWLRDQVRTPGEVAEANEAKSAGGARPEARPPARPAPAAPPTTRDASKGLPADESMRVAQEHLLAAAEASEQGDFARASALQNAAAEGLASAGNIAAAFEMELMGGAFLLQKGDVTAAREQFENIAERAHEAHHHGPGVRAELFAASSWLVERREVEAAHAYEKAAVSARRHGDLVLAIEAYRMAGESFAAVNDSGAAGAAWREALELGEGEAKELGRPTAATAARRLAAYCRAHGLVAQADSLLARAEALEANDPPPASDPP